MHADAVLIFLLWKHRDIDRCHPGKTSESALLVSEALVYARANGPKPLWGLTTLPGPTFQ